MKCIRQNTTDKIVRTNDQAAELRVSTGDWKYVPVNRVVVGDDHVVEDGMHIAAVTSNKTGG